ncbi:MAG: Aspartate aminotransferase (EC [uncultured Caballeronia sp.]|nr:MAG: Aspartate aminotransferase (EC [uncultured Caballeronia sp.]
MSISRIAESIKGSKNAVLDKLAAQLSGAGKIVIDLSKGELGISPPDGFLKNAAKAVTAGVNGYTETIRLPNLRDLVAEYANHKYEVEVGCDEIAITAGAKPALYSIALALINPGDEFIILVPYWSTFPEQVILAGGVPRMIDPGPEGVPAIDDIRRAVTARTKAILVNSPNNPTGLVYPDSLVRAIVDLAASECTFVIFDQSYYSLRYTDEMRSSFVAQTRGYDRAIIVDSFSKAWALTGWRIGYVCASRAIISLIKSIQTHINSSPNCVTQFALL